MKKLGDLLRESRESKEISIEKVAKRLLLKEEIIEALENGNWSKLPEPAYVKGFIKNYADFLDIDSNRLLALYRAEFDEKKYPKKDHMTSKSKKFTVTPEKLIPLAFITAVLAFFVYLVIQYTSILSAPSLKILSPQDDITINTTIIEVSGKTQAEATVSVDGEIIAVDSVGNFSHQVKLDEGRNIIEIIASFRFSPKSKTTRTVRLSR
jgi:cytoskeletal protein RodZ